MKIKNLLVSTVLLAGLFYSCNDEKAGTINSSQNASESKPAVPVTADPIFDEFARVICGNYDGVPANVDANYYNSFTKTLNQKLTEIEKSRLTPITNWNAANFKRNSKSDTTSVFYPFSGGDFLHVNSLYPNANHYVMMAQESVGSIPDFKKMDKIQSKEYIEAVDFILRDIYAKSYFITMNMVKDTKQSPVNGMLPILLWSVSKTGHTIMNVEEVQVDETGKKTFLLFKIGASTAKAVRITFGNKVTGEPKTLTYYSCDISDTGIEKDKGLAGVLKNIPPSNCFVKSASYLMHYATFSTIRSTVLEKALYLVQDDTGIPYIYFDKVKFKIELHGAYEKPIKDFSANLFQKDLADAYNSTQFVAKLPFSLGYHWNSGNQNEMVAIKK
ncbi:MAG: hypothetical protein K9G36_03400 [Crocinitomicaceae bacterium]|nr:hypothetical protein [Crocinitomicaceae bacterium]MCF8444119.1 hypothetical protein [Crocinitomicaceae bacterium]